MMRKKRMRRESKRLASICGDFGRGGWRWGVDEGMVLYPW